MRCPKCGRISFDHLDACRKCGTNLKAVSEMLGGFHRPDRDLNWFDMVKQGRYVQPESVMETGLSDIDVSDLTQEESQEGEPIIELSPEDLQEAANIEELDKAIDNLLEGMEE